MHHDMTLIGRVLRSARETKGLTQAALAEKAGVALRTIIALENDQRYPTYEVFYKVIRVLDISADHIFWPENVRYTPEQEQVIHELFDCPEWEQLVIINTVRVLVRSFREKRET